jgi:hypothetical protein
MNIRFNVFENNYSVHLFINDVELIFADGMNTNWGYILVHLGFRQSFKQTYEPNNNSITSFEIKDNNLIFEVGDNQYVYDLDIYHEQFLKMFGLACRFREIIDL